LCLSCLDSQKRIKKRRDKKKINCSLVQKQFPQYPFRNSTDKYIYLEEHEYLRNIKSNISVTTAKTIHYHNHNSTKDRFVYAMMHNLFKEWNRIANVTGIIGWLGYSSLLGYYQIRSLKIRDFLHIDIMIPINQCTILGQYAIKQYNSSNQNFELVVNPEWNPENMNTQQAHCGRLSILGSPLHINIWRVISNTEIRMLGEKLDDMKSGEVKNYFGDVGRDENLWKIYPENWVYPLKRCEFMGIETKCPIQSLRYLLYLGMLKHHVDYEKNRKMLSQNI